MTNLMSKSTLYDMLSMIIPGYISLLCFYIACKGKFGWRDIDYNSIPSIVIGFVLSYLVGILLHLLAKEIFNPVLRNNEKDIDEAQKKTKSEILERQKKEPNVETYYRIYYKLLGTSNTSIIILESQISFIRSITLVIPMAILAIGSAQHPIEECIPIKNFIILIVVFLLTWMINYYCKCCTLLKILTTSIIIAILPAITVWGCKGQNSGLLPMNDCCAIALLTILEICCICFMYSRQQELYKHIFEDNHYTEYKKKED